MIGAQVSPNAVQQLETAYRSLQFETVIKQGRTLLAQQQSLSPEQLAKIHEQMALSFFSLGELDSSRSHFLSLLSLYPDWKLDPIYVSPKIIAFFERLKQESAHQQSVNAVPYTRYVIVTDPRVGATWRSLLIPGWGQWYKAQKKRAYLFGGVVGLTLLGTGISALLESSAHQAYLNARDEQTIRQQYDRYNFWYKTRRTFTVLTFLGWTLNVADALWTPGKEANPLSVTISPTQFHLVVRF